MVTDNIEQPARQMALIVYVLYLVSLLIGLTGIIGVIMAYVNRASSPVWIQTHYQFQIHTFWKGVLYSLIGAVTTPILIGYVILAGLLIWLIARCLKGIRYLNSDQPYPDPTGWWI